MPEIVKEVSPPHGFSRLAFRAPLWLYRLGMGRLLGRRVMKLTHTGRKSGLPRYTVLEVVRYDRSTNTYYIAAGFGKHSDWYQNILANPHVEVESSGQHNQAIAVPLSPAEAGDELVNYAHRYPAAFKELSRFMGYHVDGSDKDIHALGNFLPIFALKPVSEEA